MGNRKCDDFGKRIRAAGDDFFATLKDLTGLEREEAEKLVAEAEQMHLDSADFAGAGMDLKVLRSNREVLRPGSDAWKARQQMLIERERHDPARWFYISFAAPGTGFLGACIVRAQGPTLALMRSHQLRINPGGQALVHGLDLDVKLPNGVTDRLLSRQDLEEKLGGAVPLSRAVSLCRE